MVYVLYFLDQIPPLNSCYPKIVAAQSQALKEMNAAIKYIVAMASVQSHEQ